MKNLPVLLQDFDAAVCHDNPVLNRGRRTLFERSLKGRIHFRTILRMNKFHKAWTAGMKIGGVSLKDAVCLLGPGYVKTRQLGFPTTYFCHRLSLDQAGAFCLQLLCDLVLAPLTGSEGFLSKPALRDVLNDSHVPNRAVTLVPHRHHGRVDPPHRSIPTNIPLLHFVVPHLAIGELPQLLAVLHQVVGVRDALEIAPQQILFRPPRDLAVSRIDSQEPAGLSFHPADANRGTVMHGAITVLADLKPCLRLLALAEVAGDGNNVIPLKLDPSHTDFHREGGPVLSPVERLHHDESRFPQLVSNLCSRRIGNRRINIENSQRQQFLAAVAELRAGFLIDVEKAKRLRIDNFYGIVAMVHQRSEQLQLPDRALAFVHLVEQTLADLTQPFLRAPLLGYVV